MTCIYGCSNKVTRLKCYAWNLFLKLDIYGTLTIANKKWSYGEIIFCYDHVESISMFSKNIDAYLIFYTSLCTRLSISENKKLPIYIIHFLLVGSDNQNVFFCHLSVKKICIKGMSITYFAKQFSNVWIKG